MSATDVAVTLVAAGAAFAAFAGALALLVLVHYCGRIAAALDELADQLAGFDPTADEGEPYTNAMKQALLDPEVRAEYERTGVVPGFPRFYEKRRLQP